MSNRMEQTMLETIKGLITSQMVAALDTLKYCMDSCPDAEWQEPHKDYPFSQVVFHALFYADYYLGRDTVPSKDQAFHKAHKDVFKDYEELEDKIPRNLYEKAFCLDYLAHCTSKLKAAVESETRESLTGTSGIEFRKTSRAELYVYNTRHIQHHAAQLGLRIQWVTGKEMPWFSGTKATA
ncbi:MAG TPA: DinB family protein [bacterium]|nr:DinB family protein [bacterium]